MQKKTEEKTRRVYLDYAASTPAHSEVILAMEPFWNKHFGNSGSIHTEGVKARQVLESSREDIANSIGAQVDELIFTGSGTESNNIAIFGVINHLLENGRELSSMHLITSAVEHPSVIDCFKVLERRGARVDYIGVTPEALVDLKELKEKLSPETVLVSVMQVNNEIGTIHPIAEVSKIVRNFKAEHKEVGEYPYVHTDACQGLLYLKMNTQSLGVDLLSIDGQKVYGPKGVGALYIKRGTNVAPFLVGGSQEFGLRPGTPNIPLIVGFAKALEITEQNREKETARLQNLQQFFVEELAHKVPHAEVNGSLDNRIVNNVNVSLPGMDSENIVIRLDAKGIACGARSACISDTGNSSYVIKALGKTEAYTTSSLRFSLGIATSKEDIQYVVDTLKEISMDFDKLN